jgi:hypothetical protein
MRWHMNALASLVAILVSLIDDLEKREILSGQEAKNYYDKLHGVFGGDVTESLRKARKEHESPE